MILGSVRRGRRTAVLVGEAMGADWPIAVFYEALYAELPVEREIRTLLSSYAAA